MLGSSPNAAAARLAAIKAAMGELQKEKKRLRDGARRRRLAAEGVWRLSEVERRVALAAYLLADYDPQPAVHALEKAGRRHGWPAKGAGELQEAAETIFLEASLDEIGDIAVEHSAAHCAALQIVEEWALFVWAARQNDVCGVAPSTDAVLAELVRRRALAGDPAPSRGGGIADGGARMWASRWRRRWGGRFGSIRERDFVPLAEMQVKAWYRPRTALPQRSVVVFGSSSSDSGVASRALPLPMPP